METQTRTLETAEVDLPYDVSGPSPTAGGRPALLMVGHRMDAGGFHTLGSYFSDRSIRKDGRDVRSPQLHSTDLRALITELGVGPVDVFASSGGAVNALALVADHPEDVGTLAAHHDVGFGAGMARFIALTSWQGEFTDEYAAQPEPDPAQFGLPTEDDGARGDALLSGTGNAITRYRPDFPSLAAAATRVVIAGGVESRNTLAGRAAAAAADALDQPLTEFPSHHGGFLGGETVGLEGGRLRRMG